MTKVAPVAAASGDPEPYIAAIISAVQAATSENNLSTMLAWIVTDAESALSGEELDAVHATASVTIDSYDYWITQGQIQTQLTAFEQAYGECLADASNPKACWGGMSNESAFPGRVGFGTTPVRTVAFGGASARTCEIDGGGVIEADVIGAFTGFMYGRTPGSAAFGAFVGSGAKAVYEFGKYLVCVFQ